MQEGWLCHADLMMNSSGAQPPAPSGGAATTVLVVEDEPAIAQAIAHGLAIVTPDPLIGQYPVRVIW